MSQELATEILKELKFMHSKFDEYDKRFDGHDNEFKNLSRSIARLEVDHGQKIDTLIDITSGILERLDSLEKNFELNSEELDKHSDQIWNLESKAGII